MPVLSIACYHQRSNMRNELIVHLNGQRRTIRGAAAFMTLSTYLRHVDRAMGTKVVCEEGDCGACTVLVGRIRDGRLCYVPINSCIVFLYQLDCTHVVTVEGLRLGTELSPIQQSMVDHHGAQCGYCTPGFIVAMTALFENRESVSEQNVREGLTGNLCRCTGYEPILKAAMAVTKQQRLHDLYPPEPIIGDIESHAREPVLVESDGRTFFGAVDLEGAAKFKAENPDAVIVQGATDVGVMHNKRGYVPPAVISLSRIPGLDQIETGSDAIAVGATASLVDLEETSKDVLPALHEMLQLFGSPQIRHGGTLAGNIANGSPIADTLPFLFVTGATLEVYSVRGQRSIRIDSLYHGYKQLDLQRDEIITRILIPRPSAGEVLRCYKVSKRRDLDISSFTAAIRLKMEGDRITSSHIAYGGVGPVVLTMNRTAALLDGREISEGLFREAGEVACEEIRPISDVRGSSDFRFQLARNILMKFYWEELAREETARMPV